MSSGRQLRQVRLGPVYMLRRRPASVLRHFGEVHLGGAVSHYPGGIFGTQQLTITFIIFRTYARNHYFVPIDRCGKTVLLGNADVFLKFLGKERRHSASICISTSQMHYICIPLLKYMVRSRSFGQTLSTTSMFR